MSEAESAELARRYLTPNPDGTWTGAKTLGREFGIVPTAVYAHLRKHGVATRSARESHANGKRCKPVRNLPVDDAPTCACGCQELTAWNQRKNRWNRYVSGHYRRDAPYKQRDWLLREYVDKRRTINEIASDCGVTRSSVRKAMRKHAIPVRAARPEKGAPGRLRAPLTGAKNPAWKGGVAKWSYSSDWKSLARAIRYRDNWTCQDCGETRKHWGHSLHVHHIDGDKLNNAPDNLVSLCASCHHERHRQTA